MIRISLTCRSVSALVWQGVNNTASRWRAAGAPGRFEVCVSRSGKQISSIFCCRCSDHRCMLWPVAGRGWRQPPTETSPLPDQLPQTAKGKERLWVGKSNTICLTMPTLFLPKSIYSIWILEIIPVHYRTFPHPVCIRRTGAKMSRSESHFSAPSLGRPRSRDDCGTSLNILCPFVTTISSPRPRRPTTFHFSIGPVTF